MSTANSRSWLGDVFPSDPTQSSVSPLMTIPLCSDQNLQVSFPHTSFPHLTSQIFWLHSLKSMCMYLKYVHYILVGVSEGQKRCGVPWSWGSEPPCRVWGLKSDLLVLVDAMPSSSTLSSYLPVSELATSSGQHPKWYFGHESQLIKPGFAGSMQTMRNPSSPFASLALPTALP